MDYVKTTTGGYTPQDNELCIAKYENEYDCGNLEVVEHKDIGPMLKDFMEPNRLTTLCLKSTKKEKKKL